MGCSPPVLRFNEDARAWEYVLNGQTHSYAGYKMAFNNMQKAWAQRLASNSMLAQKDKLTTITQTDYAPSLPKLCEASVISAQVRVCVARLVELADSGLIPHWRIDGGEPLFQPSKAKAWVRKYLAFECDGRSVDLLEIQICQHVPAAEGISDLPLEIGMIRGLCFLGNPCKKMGTCIYFLCDAGKVVYVGKGTKANTRIGNHAAGVKNFDSVFYLPMLEENLSDAESKFTKMIKPKYNINKNGRLQW